MTIRRFLAASLLAILLIVPAASRAGTLELGLKVGANYSNFTGDFHDFADTKFRTGFVGGGILAFAFSPALAVQTEGLFTVKGADLGNVQEMDQNGVPTGRTFSATVDLRYIEVPVLLRGTLLPGPVSPYLYVGPTFGFNLDGRFNTDLPGLSQDLKDIKPVDYGVAAGGGVRLQVAGMHLLGDLRYTRGLADVYDIPGNLESINSCWTLSAGLIF